MTLVTGLLSNSIGACPVCGREVPRVHSWNGARLTEGYSCYRCGPTRYVAFASRA